MIIHTKRNESVQINANNMGVCVLLKCWDAGSQTTLALSPEEARAVADSLKFYANFIDGKAGEIGA